MTLALESSHRAAKLVDQQLRGEAVDWDKDCTAILDRAVGGFRVFVHTWYSGELQRVLLHQAKDERIKRAITCWSRSAERSAGGSFSTSRSLPESPRSASVLGGYVLDERNPLVRDGRGPLGAALKFI